MPIHKKILEFQKLNIVLVKEGENPHFNSNYVTLNEVLAKVKKPLNDVDILILQEPTDKGLKTRLIDTEDSSEVTCFMPYGEMATAQKLGSWNTYLRRYSLVTLLGLQDVDDDGNEASTAPVKPVVEAVAKVAPKPVTQPETVPAETEENLGGGVDPEED